MAKPQKKRTLFADDENGSGGGESSDLKINREYADRYDTWRRGEEMQKLKDRYGPEANLPANETESDDSSSSEAENWTEAYEKGFLRALAAVKSGRNLDENRTFYRDSSNEKKGQSDKKKGNDKALFVKDYERKLAIERAGELSNSDGDGDDGNASDPELPYAEESRRIKESLTKFVHNDSDQSDDETGGLLTKRQKTAQEIQQEEVDYLAWLRGRVENDAILQGENEQDVQNLKQLKNYWSKPDLDEKEKFLRDFVLNQKYKEGGSDKQEIPTYDEIVDDDEDAEFNERAEEFETKYNFRFEEPDPEFIKCYPRTIKDSLRRTDEKRKEQRDTLKERKEKEKRQKREDMKQLKSMKRSELMEKLAKIKEIVGDDKLNIDPDELEADFDPSVYDKKMQELFSENYYNQSTVEEEKPVFSDSDNVLSDNESERDFDKWEPEGTVDQLEETDAGGAHDGAEENHVGGDKVVPEEEVTRSRSGRKRKRKSALAKALERQKPPFDPTKESLQNYLDQYYALDAEDFVGDTPCRFKYRSVPANDFGLSLDEILAADEKELNAWVSVKKASQYRSDKEEAIERKSFTKKAENVFKKKRILPSLFVEQEETEKPSSSKSVDNNSPKTLEAQTEGAKKKRRRKRKGQGSSSNSNLAPGQNGEVKTEEANAKVADEKEIDIVQDVKKDCVESAEASTSPATEKTSKSKKRKRKSIDGEISNQKNSALPNISDERLAAYGLNPKKVRQKLKYGKGKID